MPLPPPPTPTKPKKVSFREFLQTDRAILIACIGIAFFFWILTKLSHPYKTNLSFSLAYRLPKDKILSQTPLNQIEVVAEGSGWDLLRLRWQGLQQKIWIEVPMEAYQRKMSIPIQPKIAQQLPHLRILLLEHEQLDLMLEDTMTKELPVFAENLLELSPEYHLTGSLDIQPNTIRVFGPASTIKGLRACTVEVKFKGLRQSFDLPVPIKLHSNSNVRYQPNSVQCRGEIEQVTEKELEIPIQIKNAPEDIAFILLSKKIRVTCLVSLKRYEELSPDKFRAEVDFAEFDLLQHRSIHIRLTKIPNFAYQVNYYPKSAEYIVQTQKK
jgi:hypothetical protein